MKNKKEIYFCFKHLSAIKEIGFKYLSNMSEQNTRALSDVNQKSIINNKELIDPFMKK
jgi:hypothetical protein